MTRKDYELIAAALRKARDRAMSSDELLGIDRATDEIGEALYRDNSRFDGHRFNVAAGAILPLNDDEQEVAAR